jgi:hypothetical protein
MKPKKRCALSQLPFKDKIRKVGELIRLSRKVKAQRVGEDSRELSAIQQRADVYGNA